MVQIRIKPNHWKLNPFKWDIKPLFKELVTFAESPPVNEFTVSFQLNFKIGRKSREIKEKMMAWIHRVNTADYNYNLKCNFCCKADYNTICILETGNVIYSLQCYKLFRQDAGEIWRQSTGLHLRNKAFGNKLHPVDVLLVLSNKCLGRAQRASYW